MQEPHCAPEQSLQGSRYDETASHFIIVIIESQESS
jgi:hypothetical protein